MILPAGMTVRDDLAQGLHRNMLPFGRGIVLQAQQVCNRFLVVEAAHGHDGCDTNTYEDVLEGIPRVLQSFGT